MKFENFDFENNETTHPMVRGQSMDRPGPIETDQLPGELCVEDINRVRNRVLRIDLKIEACLRVKTIGFINWP